MPLTTASARAMGSHRLMQILASVARRYPPNSAASTREVTARR